MAKLRLTVDEFAERVNKAYNGRITIIKETYTGTRNKVTAYCNVHKIFFEVKVARELTRKNADCPECNKESAKNRIIKNWKTIYQKFINKYGNKFSYDEASYEGSKKLMKVHCNDCGEDFEISPNQHLKRNNGGCPNCRKRKVAKCSICGKEIITNRHSNVQHIYCDECKKQIRKIKAKKAESKDNVKRISKNIYIKCSFCGEYHKFGEHCKHQLCNEHQSVKWYRNLIPFGFDFSKIGTIEYIDEYYKSIYIILIEYYDNMLSPKQIYEKYNCSEYINSDVTIKNIIINAGFKVRNLSEAVKNAIQTNTLNVEYLIPNPYKTERHTTWEGKTFLLRSSYETDFANILDEQQTPYDVEALRIRYFDTQKQKERIAIPDFYLPETNTIIEVKSAWTFDQQNMIDKRSAYLKLGYNFKLWYEHEFVEIESIITNKRAPK